MGLSPKPVPGACPLAPKSAVPLGSWTLCSGTAPARAPLSLAGEFVISPVEGELRVRKDAELDRENIAFYNLTIAARDRGVPPLSSTVSPLGWRRGLWGAIPHPQLLPPGLYLHSPSLLFLPLVTGAFLHQIFMG